MRLVFASFRAISLLSVSLYYLDLSLARGKFGAVLQQIIPGADSAGEIVETGEGVKGWQNTRWSLLNRWCVYLIF